MATGKNIDTETPCSMMIEILFIDTAGSRKLYQSAKLNSAEKAKAQGFLKEQFREACAKHNGKIHSWYGDGGFAFFSSSSDG
jgi:hypothetical protein